MDHREYSNNHDENHKSNLPSMNQNFNANVFIRKRKIMDVALNSTMNEMNKNIENGHVIQLFSTQSDSISNSESTLPLCQNENFYRISNSIEEKLLVLFQNLRELIGNKVIESWPTEYELIEIFYENTSSRLDKKIANYCLDIMNYILGTMIHQNPYDDRNLKLLMGKIFDIIYYSSRGISNIFKLIKQVLISEISQFTDDIISDLKMNKCSKIKLLIHELIIKKFPDLEDENGKMISSIIANFIDKKMNCKNIKQFIKNRCNPQVEKITSDVMNKLGARKYSSMKETEIFGGPQFICEIAESSVSSTDFITKRIRNDSNKNQNNILIELKKNIVISSDRKGNLKKNWRNGERVSLFETKFIEDMKSEIGVIKSNNQKILKKDPMTKSVILEEPKIIHRVIDSSSDSLLEFPTSKIKDQKKYGSILIEKLDDKKIKKILKGGKIISDDPTLLVPSKSKMTSFKDNYNVLKESKINIAISSDEKGNLKKSVRNGERISVLEKDCKKSKYKLNEDRETEIDILNSKKQSRFKKDALTIDILEEPQIVPEIKELSSDSFSESTTSIIEDLISKEELDDKKMSKEETIFFSKGEKIIGAPQIISDDHSFILSSKTKRTNFNDNYNVVINRRKAITIKSDINRNFKKSYRNGEKILVLANDEMKTILKAPKIMKVSPINNNNKIQAKFDNVNKFTKPKVSFNLSSIEEVNKDQFEKQIVKSILKPSLNEDEGKTSKIMNNSKNTRQVMNNCNEIDFSSDDIELSETGSEILNKSDLTSTLSDKIYKLEESDLSRSSSVEVDDLIETISLDSDNLMKSPITTPDSKLSNKAIDLKRITEHSKKTSPETGKFEETIDRFESDLESSISDDYTYLIDTITDHITSKK